MKPMQVYIIFYFDEMCHDMYPLDIHMLLQKVDELWRFKWFQFSFRLTSEPQII